MSDTEGGWGSDSFGDIWGTTEFPPPPAPLVDIACVVVDVIADAEVEVEVLDC